MGMDITHCHPIEIHLHKAGDFWDFSHSSKCSSHFDNWSMSDLVPNQLKRIYIYIQYTLKDQPTEKSSGNLAAQHKCDYNHLGNITLNCEIRITFWAVINFNYYQLKNGNIEGIWILGSSSRTITCPFVIWVIRSLPWSATGMSFTNLSMKTIAEHT